MAVILAAAGAQDITLLDRNPKDDRSLSAKEAVWRAGPRPEASVLGKCLKLVVEHHGGRWIVIDQAITLNSMELVTRLNTSLYRF
jgi:hypothetical protein